MWDSINLNDYQMRERLSPSARKAYAEIAAAWSLTDDEATRLVELQAGQWTGFKNPASETEVLAKETIEGISLVIGIYKGLNTYFTQHANRWPKLENRNPYFEGQSPLKVMLERGQPAMRDIRDTIDGWCLGSPLDFLENRQMKTARAVSYT